MKAVFIALFVYMALASTAHSDDRQDCRQTREVSEVADCIERGVYDPCDDAGSSWGRGMCADAHIVVAERRIAQASSALLKRFDQWNLSESKREEFASAQEAWQRYREKYCNASNSLAEYFIENSEETIFAMDISYSFCVLRLTQRYADELEFTLSKANQ
jgi:uncharacterized protein YecT (DUF1311 family)